MATRFQSLAPTVRLADQVADALAAEVRSGRLSEGDRLPTEAVLAEKAISRHTHCSDCTYTNMSWVQETPAGAAA